MVKGSVLGGKARLRYFNRSSIPRSLQKTDHWEVDKNALQQKLCRIKSSYQIALTLEDKDSLRSGFPKYIGKYTVQLDIGNSEAVLRAVLFAGPPRAL